MKPVSIVWFRRDLRLYDNEAVARGTAANRNCLYVFIIDPWFFQQPETGLLRVRFLFESLAALDKALRSKRSRLLILKGESVAALQNLLKTVRRAGFEPELYYNNDIQVTYGKERDESIRRCCQEQDVKLVVGHSYFLLHDEALMDDWWRRYYQYQYAEQYEIPVIQPADQTLLGAVNLLPQLDPQNLAAELGLSLPTARQNLFSGGERSARQTVYSFLKDRVDGYHWKLSRPHLAQRGATSLLSPHLAFGTISNRSVFQAAVHHRAKLQASQPKKAFDISTFLDRLRWRDSFTQRLWFHPQLMWQNQYSEFDELYNDNPLSGQRLEYFERWQAGETGFPLLDAAMKQLEQDGFINFRMRAMAASFLTINCGVSWHHGARHFMNCLVDGDVAINHWQWQMQAGVTNPLSPVFRIYSPTKNFRDRDGSADYVHFWLPETAGQDVEATLRSARPMLDFSATRKENGQRLSDLRKLVRQRIESQQGEAFAKAVTARDIVIRHDRRSADRYKRYFKD